MNESVRRRIAAVLNNNSEGKSSRFKGLAIVRVQTSSTQSLEYAIAGISPLPSPLFNLFRNENTMTPPMSPGIQRPCFIPLDPPHRCSTPYESNSPLPPSTFINLPPLNILPPPLQLSSFRPAMRIKCFRPAM